MNPSVLPPSEADIDACQRILRQGSKSFALASLLLPRTLRRSVAPVYAFCRVADDAVDEGGTEVGRDAEIIVDELRSRLFRIAAQTPDDGSVDRALSRVMVQKALPVDVFEALLEGFLWDAQGRRYETLEDLEAYAMRVAGTVGILMALLMGVRSPWALARACDLGVAMQYTNIVRDIGEDARRGRIYLPMQWVREAGIDAEAFCRAPSFSPGLGALSKRLLDLADGLYARADQGIEVLPSRCRPAIRGARLVYAEIGAEVRRRGYDSVSGRAVVSLWRKIALMVRGLRGPLGEAPPLGSGQAMAEPVLASARRFVESACHPLGAVVGSVPLLESGTP